MTAWSYSGCSIGMLLSVGWDLLAWGLFIGGTVCGLIGYALGRRH